jgi:hypothetical protein
VTRNNPRRATGMRGRKRDIDLGAESGYAHRRMPHGGTATQSAFTYARRRFSAFRTFTRVASVELLQTHRHDVSQDDGSRKFTGSLDGRLMETPSTGSR